MTGMTRLALALAVAFVALFPMAAHADEPKELGLDLVPWSKKVGDKRYESPRDYEGTVKFFHDRFKGWRSVKWSHEVSLPAVKYIHIESLSKRTKWSGINIYGLPDGRVRYYLLEREAAPPKTAAKP